MARVRFTRSFLIAGGPQYNKGDRAELPEYIADQVIEQEAGVLIKAPIRPPMDKMVHVANTKGARSANGRKRNKKRR